MSTRTLLSSACRSLEINVWHLIDEEQAEGMFEPVLNAALAEVSDLREALKAKETEIEDLHQAWQHRVDKEREIAEYARKRHENLARDMATFAIDNPFILRRVMPEPEYATLVGMVRANRKIDGIKFVRQMYGLGLKDSKQIVEALQRTLIA
jgi:ribosomal protein L7/L12